MGRALYGALSPHIRKERTVAEIRRKGHAIWSGDKSGSGTVSTESEALHGERYSFHTRFEDQPGTNPEELIAAAHAGCFSMAFAFTLSENGYTPRYIKTEATCALVPQAGGGFKIARMDLDVTAKVLEIDEEAFQEMVEKADQGCPVSNLLRPGLEIVLRASLAE
jgi:osmotically inducible protein OsmC